MRIRFTAISCIILAGWLSVSVCPAQESQEPKATEAFKDGIHYLRIARWDLAKSNLQYVATHGNPVEILALSITWTMLVSSLLMSLMISLRRLRQVPGVCTQIAMATV